MNVMSEQPTRRRRTTVAAAQTLVVGVAVATLVAIVGTGQVLAVAPPDERVLERQSRIDHQPAAGQAGEQGKAGELSQGSPAGIPRRFIRPEPPMGPPPQLDDDKQIGPAPVRAAPASGPGGLVVSVAVAALLLALGAATTWRVRHRRPRPESTA